MISYYCVYHILATSRSKKIQEFEKNKTYVLSHTYQFGQ